MDAPSPRWRRRKTARPSEIVAAALEVFAEKGFAAAKLEDIAARAGVSKGALYLYFDTKDALFRAVVREAVTPNIEAVRAMAEAYPGRFADLAPLVLARVWHDTVVSVAIGALSALIARAQAKGEIKAGDPRLYAISLIGPMIVGFLWREVFEPVGAEPLDLAAMAAQHARTVLSGMLALPEAA